MDPRLEEALQNREEVFITTWDSSGRPGTVPVWFLYDSGKVYIATEPGTRKVRKLWDNPRVRLTFRDGGTIAVEGTGRICSEVALIRKVAPVLNRKYGGAWGRDVRMVERLLSADLVLLEVTFQ